MSSIRKFVYASLLAASSLNFAPSLAAQEAQGTFKLTHAVHWQNADVPAGDYRFSFDSSRPLGVLMLSRLDGTRGGFVIMVPDTSETDGSGPSRLMLSTTAGGSYVSAMQLPEFGITLNFRIPKPSEKQMAKAGTAVLAAAQ